MTFMNSNVNNIGMEGVNFQTSRVFFEELTMLFEELRKEKQDKIPDSEIVERMHQCVKTHTGLDVRFDFGDLGPAVQVPNVNKNHPLVVDMNRNLVSSGTGLSLIEKAGGVLRGGVNLTTGKVYGAFCDIVHVLHFPILYLAGKRFISEELTAISQHEIGHLVTYYLYMSHAATTNQVLAGLSKAWQDNQTVAERETVLISVHKALNLKSDGVKRLAQSTDKRVVEAVVLSNVMQQSTSALGSNIYDMTSWEYLSDQYAARMGAGRHLVTALDKVMNSVFTPSFRSMPLFLAIEAFKILTTFSALMTFNPFPLIAVMLTTMPGRDTYDKPEARFQRIRNQIIENQKVKNLSDNDRERLSADLLAVDQIISHVNDRRDFFTVLWHTFSSDFRNQWKAEELQKDLEKIAANDLFDKVNQLKGIKA